MKIVVGIDMGSVATKCVVLKNGEVIAKALVNTGVDTEQSAEIGFKMALDQGKISEAEISNIVSTGYGRRLFTRADKIVTEISAVALGAAVLTKDNNFLIVDVGGQDTKVVEVGEKGDVLDFLMNDKCAAGTGRFLEIMAQVLETDLSGFSELALKSHNPVTINSTCSVFAESEIISLLSKAAKKEDIAGGLVKSIALRISSMMSQFGKKESTFFCGGGAKCEPLRRALEEARGVAISVIDTPQFVAALGAAWSAL